MSYFRKEISKFCFGDNNNPNFLWENYFRFVARLESGTGDQEEDANEEEDEDEDDSWRSVEERTRKAVRGVHFCDVTATDHDGRFVAETG